MSNNATLAYLQKVTGIGGTEQFFLSLGNGLTKRNWNLQFGLLHEPKNPVMNYTEALHKHGWTVKSIPISHHISPSALLKTRQWLKRTDPDLLNTHLIHGDFYGWMASFGRNYPLVTTKHNDDAFKSFPGYPWFARWLNSGFDAGVTISDHLKGYYQNELGVKNPVFRTIPYGLNPNWFNQETQPESEHGPLAIPDEVVCFGIVARLTEQKGHTDLIEAFGQLRSRENKIHLVIVGSGPLEQKLKQQVDRLKLEKKVTFTGFRRDVSDLLSQFDVFVHPSRWEGFGRVFLEAMSAHLPIIATNVSAIPEIVIEGETGILVPPKSPSELASAMKRFVDTPGWRRSMGDAGYRRLVEQFSLDEMIDQYDRFYRSLLDQQSWEPLR